MRHRKKSKYHSSKNSYNKALMKNQAVSLVLHEKIKTTKTKAKYLRSVVEKLITTAKKQDLTARRKLLASLPKKGAVRKLMEELGPRYKGRPGGYTRIVRIGPRKGDGAEMVNIELV